MTRRLGVLASLSVMALLAVAALLPLAAADHAYSHRYVVYGRVVDADGNPVPGLTIDLSINELETEGRCANQPGTETEAWGPTATKPVTNEFGEFTFCAHAHSMSRVLPGSATLLVQETGTTKEITFDAYKRVTFATIQLPETHADANPTILDTSYTVAGRLWRDGGGETYVESIRVYGQTIDREPVVITLEYNGGKTVTVNTTTNDYGDFAMRLPVEERVTEGKVTIVADNKTSEAAVDATTGMTTFVVEYPEQKDPFVAKFLLGLGIVGGLVVVGGAGWVGYRRVSAKRAEDVARASSTRKRAQR